ncbi:hypothetical protein M885DRAFT_616090, partial [Pelagophyceae sp. CCMP2097]
FRAALLYAVSVSWASALVAPAGPRADFRPRAEPLEIRRAELRDLRHIVELSHREFRPRSSGDVLQKLWAEYESVNLLLLLYVGFYLRLTYQETYEVDDDHRVLIALDDAARVRGVVEISKQPFCTLAPPVPRPRFLKGPDLRPYLSNLLVDQPFRNQGLGKALVKRCETEVRESWRGDSLALHHDKEDAKLTVFYQRLGYLPVEAADEVKIDGFTLGYVAKALASR